jgi:hypothetical protein
LLSRFDGEPCGGTSCSSVGFWPLRIFRIKRSTLDKNECQLINNADK